jgi:hypothetical protein
VEQSSSERTWSFLSALDGQLCSEGLLKRDKGRDPNGRAGENKARCDQLAVLIILVGGIAGARGARGARGASLLFQHLENSDASASMSCFGYRNREIER